MLDVLLELFARARTDHRRVTIGEEAFIAWPYG